MLSVKKKLRILLAEKIKNKRLNKSKLSKFGAYVKGNGIMDMNYISREVEKIKNKFDQSDPSKLCEDMKISLLYHPMGLFENACKGFYMEQSRKRVIIVNSQLDQVIQKIVLVHEIGHAVLHRKLPGVKSFHDFSLFDNTSIYEYEANIFAADFLLDNEDVLKILNEDISFFNAASILGVPAELLDFKFRILKKKGYKIIDPPINAGSNFLKKY